MDLSEVDYISKNVENEEDELRKKYPKLFKYVDILKGTIVSIGAHPAGVVVTDRNIYDELGTLSSNTNEYPIVQIDMKEVEFLKYIKLDLLKLNTMGVINKTCELAGIDIIDPNNIDLEDWNVYKDIRDNGGTGIFQWESDSATDYYKRLFSEETISSIKQRVENLSYLELMSVGNGAIRPAGNSYRNSLAKGNFHDNGSEVLNKLLEPTLGNLVYQEQILEFLNKFCGFSLGEADMVRRGFAKKTGTDKYIPKIKAGFIKTMVENYGYSKVKANDDVEYFLEVIKAGSDYLFSLNHSLSYSIIGYITAWLRYHYPLEFITASLEVFEGKEEKTGSLIKFANKNGIEINPITFGKSKGHYFMDKQNNAIYKGIASIKYLNSQIGEELYQLSQNKSYSSFMELLYDIDKTSIQSNQLEILIKLEFFNEFGNDKKLLTIYKIFDKFNSRKQLNKETNANLISLLGKLGISEDYIKQNSSETDKLYRDIDFQTILFKLEDNIPNNEFNVKDKIKAQLEYLTYINKQYDVDIKIWVVTSISTYKNPYMEIHNIRTGKKKKLKLFKYDILKNNGRPEEGDFIRIDKSVWQRKNVKRGDEWVKSDEKQLVLKKYFII